MGEKASPDDIKSGADQAVIEGRFDLTLRTDIQKNLVDMGIDVDEDGLTVRRTVNAQGKSRVYLNGSLSALNSLRDLVSPLITVTGQAAPLIEMTGQHDNRHLQSKAYHLDIVDRFSGLWDERTQFTSRFLALATLRSHISQLQQEMQAREQRLDYLRFQKDELEIFDIRPGEDEELMQRLKKLKNSTRLKNFFAEAEQVLASGETTVLDQLKTCHLKIQELLNIDSSLIEEQTKIDQARHLIEDTIFDLRHRVKELEEEPAEIEALEERYSQFRRLQKKYGETAEHFINTLQGLREEIKTLESSDEKLEALRKQESTMSLELKALSSRLHRLRKTAAKEFQSLVNEELRDLNMKGVELEVALHEWPELTSTGHSHLEFLIRISKKDEARSLAKYASGGELSRILLSIKQITGNSDLPRTYLFDEVDTGVSGVTAEKVGRKLKSIARGQQVICVTHLAQVAAFADVHYLIEKLTTKKGVEMRLRILQEKDRIEEIARLVSGEKITKTSLDHAKELLKVTSI
jgi:DNA repair protein RecN (Recombination protein N)